jgi:hypothetical protein
MSRLLHDPEALAMVAHAKVLSGHKLEQLVLRLQRHSGESKETCWRFVIQYGIKASTDHRPWTEIEVELLREELVKRPLDEVARKLKRTPEAIRSILKRHKLSLRDIRCDLFSVESMARALHVGRREVLFWIEQGWLQSSISVKGSMRFHTITPEALMLLYKRHLKDLLKRGLPSQSLFEAYLEYCYSPKHTTGQHLLEVRRDKRERVAVATLKDHTDPGRDHEDDLRDPNPELGHDFSEGLDF